MVYRVALVGHSQLPYIEDYEDVEFEHFKKKGARIGTFTDSSCFGRICSDQWDCVIIFLGGNDLCDHHNADQMVNDLMRLVGQVRASTILVTEIEKRTYRPDLASKYNTTTEQYMRLATTANNKLRRKSSSLGTFHLIHLPSSYNRETVDGGIHFNEIASRSLIAKYAGAIRHARYD